MNRPLRNILAFPIAIALTPIAGVAWAFLMIYWLIQTAAFSWTEKTPPDLKTTEVDLWKSHVAKLNVQLAELHAENRRVEKLATEREQNIRELLDEVTGFRIGAVKK